MQEGPEKAAGQQHEGHELHADAIKVLVKPKVIKLKISRVDSCKLNQLAHIEQPKLGKHAGACIAKGPSLSWPQSKVKAQTKTQAAAVVMALALAAAPTPAPGQA
ncbi:PREDICTED: 60S ribosomal protein L29-like [Myotis davidii]|uniref:60S ribosomal protein L29-like n=1 Tax=Myotis davidii TaxID=225400 RepID=UPI0003EC4D54|nr:PREDICTED: 60S ribosomal protein L29-like [Myotis davidii]